MAVGLNEPEEILPVAGIKLASVAAGIKKSSQHDLVVFTFEECQHSILRKNNFLGSNL